jgi:hypothetical protein
MITAFYLNDKPKPTVFSVIKSINLENGVILYRVRCKSECCEGTIANLDGEYIACNFEGWFNNYDLSVHFRIYDNLEGAKKHACLNEVEHLKLEIKELEKDLQEKKDKYENICKILNHPND